MRGKIPLMAANSPFRASRESSVASTNYFASWSLSRRCHSFRTKRIRVKVARSDDSGVSGAFFGFLQFFDLNQCAFILA